MISFNVVSFMKCILLHRKQIKLVLKPLSLEIPPGFQMFCVFYTYIILMKNIYEQTLIVFFYVKIKKMD